MTTVKRIWDNCELIGEVMKTGSSKLKVELTARDGVKYLNIREWYMTKREQVWKPGMNGVAIPIAIPIEGKVAQPVANIVELINIALAKAPDFEIENEANAVYAQPKAK